MLKRVQHDAREGVIDPKAVTLNLFQGLPSKRDTSLNFNEPMLPKNELSAFLP
jgi:hypothetical protein